MRSFILLLLGLSCCLLSFGCASTDKKKKSDREKVSTVPWNRPADWEGKGVLGGMIQ
ncbi:MAG: hypothetical protein ACFCUX_00785 [Candidatus Methylacidiphilales bacterium]